MIYYALESKRTNGYKYYYFQERINAGVGNVKVTDDPDESLAFHHIKDAREFLENNPDLAERFDVVGISGKTPKFYEPET